MDSNREVHLIRGYGYMKEQLGLLEVRTVFVHRVPAH
jgi:hypothetical protein